MCLSFKKIILKNYLGSKNKIKIKITHLPLSLIESLFWKTVLGWNEKPTCFYFDFQQNVYDKI